MNKTLPELPPGWTWHKDNGKLNVYIQWRAVGPTVSRWPLEAYGRFKHNQTPEAAAEDAWKIWERLSGVSKEEWEYLQFCKADTTVDIHKKVATDKSMWCHKCKAPTRHRMFENGYWACQPCQEDLDIPIVVVETSR